MWPRALQGNQYVLRQELNCVHAHRDCSSDAVPCEVLSRFDVVFALLLALLAFAFAFIFLVFVAFTLSFLACMSPSFRLSLS